MISRNPITPVSYRSKSFTPAVSISGPPNPTSSRSGRRSPSSSATPAAWRSPEASPATKMTSATASCCFSCQRWKRALDLGDDLEGDSERPSSILTGDYDRRFSIQRRDEAVELEAQRLSLGRDKRNSIDEVSDVHRAGGRTRRIEFLLQAEEVARAGSEIEREVAALLKDPDLPDAIARDAARRDVRNCARRERHARVGDVEHRRQYRHPHCR